jgi:hypothetical protein
MTSGQGGAGGFDTCEGVENVAEFIPVSMFLQVDKSLSMLTDDKWGKSKSAFLKFFDDPLAQKSLNVALRFWPDGGCDFGTCDATACAVPEVPLGAVSDSQHVTLLKATFENKSPFGLTPMSAALAGATQWAVARQAQVGSKEKVVVVLMTDGEPTACGTNVEHIAAIADSAYQAQQILSFVVGLDGSSVSQLDTIAKGGHTEKAFLIGKGDVQADLLAALQKIQGSVLKCAFEMPVSSDPNKVVDPKLVNVSYDPSMGDKVTLTQESGLAACGESEGSWYYDTPAMPGAILLCPKTCEKVQADLAGKLAIVLGCATQLK